MTTVGALLEINDSKIVFNLDCTCGTLALTLLAADTADLAGLASLGALVLIAAAHNGGNSFRDNVNQMVGTSLCAHSAADTQLGIDTGQTIADVDGILRADGNTVAICQAVVGTAGFTGEEQLAGGAGLNTHILVTRRYIVAVAAAGNIGNLFYHITGFHAQCSSNTCSSICTAGDTEGGSSSSIHRYFRKWEAAGFFLKLWKKGLAEYDDLEGIAWRWQSIDGSMTKAPTVRKTVGPNSTDRGKKRNEAAHSRRRTWSPVVNRRDRSPQA